MAELQPSGIKDLSVRKAFRDALDHDRITETEMKKIIRSINDARLVTRNELEDLRRILLDSTKLTPRAGKLLEDFVIRSYRLAGGTGNLSLIPMIHGRRFDSFLSRPTSSASRIWNLTIEARVFFDAIETPGVCTDRGSNRECVAWPGGGFSEFLQKVRSRSRFWSDRFFLKVPDGLPSLAVKTRSDPPYVACKFNLLTVPKGARRHRRIRVVFLDPGARNMRAHARLYSNRSANDKERAKDGITYKRVTLWHELSHLLGFEHIGVIRGYPECTAPDSDTNATVCYGKNHKDRRDVTGYGTDVSKMHATPWTTAIAKHTFTHPDDWQVLVNVRTREKYTLEPVTRD
jgi:hypothetical protein